MRTDIADGPGVRATLFVSGCRNRCPGCHNAEAQDFSFGRPFDGAAEEELMGALSHDYVRGLTLCGGEPFEEENQRALLPFVRRVREAFPDKDIWAWTGYEWEDLMEGGRKRCEATPELLSYMDALVCGRFVLSERDITDANRWRGSRNQYVVDVAAALESGEREYLKGIPGNPPGRIG